MSRFDECLRFVLKWEGGYVNHPNDPGGATNQGVTQSVYDEWRIGRGLGRQPVSGLARDERDAIYRDRYWRAVRGDDLPAPVDLVVFDAAVNSGPRQAIKWLQRAVGVAADGVLGPVTLGAVNMSDHAHVADAVLKQRRAFMDGLVRRDQRYAVFLPGWNNRINDLQTEVV